MNDTADTSNAGSVVH